MSDISTITVGIIGLGAIARRHLKLLEAVPAARIVGLCDVNAESLKNARTAHEQLLAEARDYQDYRTMLKETRPGAVIICSPHADHFQQIMDSLASGAHVLTEKPLVNNQAQAAAVIQRAQEAKTVIGIAYQRHTMPPFRYMHEAIQSGRWGAVKSVAGYQQEGWKVHNAGTWRHVPEISGGGYLHDAGSHLLDAVLWMTGLKPTHVSAIQDNAGAPVDINTAMNIRFAGGALGALAVMGDVPGWSQQIVIGCEKATVFYSREAGLCVQQPGVGLTTVTAEEMPPESNVVQNFFNAIQGIEPIAAPLECGLAVMRLTEAAMASARAGGCLVEVVYN